MSQFKKAGDQWDQDTLSELFQSISLLKNPKEFANFFEDLCTPAELRSMAERWRVARLLDEGDSYRTINEQTGVSTTTITRVARSMTYGTRGYRTLLDRSKKEAVK